LVSDVKASSVSLKASSQFTVSFWVNLAAVHRRDTTLIASGKFQVTIPTMHRGISVTIPMQDKSLATVHVKTGLRLRHWTHVAIVAEHNQAKVFYDGGLVQSSKLKGFPAYVHSDVRLGGVNPTRAMIASLLYFPGVISSAQLKAIQPEGAKLRKWNGHLVVKSSVPRLVKGAVCAGWDQLEPSNEFSLQAYVRVTKNITALTNIFHKGNATDLHSPSLFLDGRKLVAKLQTEDREITIRSTKPLPFNRYKLVTITAQPGKFALWVGDKMVASAAIGTPMTNRAPLYCSGPLYEPSPADLQEVTYSPYVVSATSIASAARRTPKATVQHTVLSTNVIRVGPRTKIASADRMTLASSFSFSFFVSYDAWVSGTRFVLRRGSFGVALSQGTAASTGLTVFYRAGDKDRSVSLSSPLLKRKTWTHVAVALGNHTVTVYINGVSVAEDKYQGWLKVPTGDVFCALPQDKSAFAHLMRVVYYDGIVDKQKVQDAFKQAHELKLPAWPSHPIMVRDHRSTLIKAAVCAGDSAMLSSNDFSYGFWLRIAEVSSAITNIFYKGESSEARMPAVFLNAGNTQLLVRQMDEKKQVYLNTERVPLKQWVHVVLTAEPGALRVYVDGKQIASTRNISIPLVDHHPLFCSANSSTYSPAKAEIGRVYYAPYALTEAQVVSLMKLSRPEYAVVSQVWTGSYVFNGKTNRVTLTSFSVSSGMIAGEGTDTSGTFKLKGTVSNNNQVVMDKSYPTWTVKYTGTLSADGKKITGAWTAGTNKGTFQYDRTS